MTGAPTPQDALVAYAQVQRAADADIMEILRDAYADVSRDIDRLGATPNNATLVKLQRLNAIKAAILRSQGEVFRRTGKVIDARRVEAAGRALEVSGRYDIAAAEAIGQGPAGRALARSFQQTDASAVDVAVARITGSHTTLSSRVYRTQAWSDSRLERRINSGLARGLNARQLAAEVREFVNPNTPGGVRFAAMRLARTEINNAYHAMAIQAALNKPWVTKMQWHKSKSHALRDICDELDGQLFAVAEVPRKPHPQCLCVITQVVDEDDDAFLDALVSDLAAPAPVKAVPVKAVPIKAIATRPSVKKAAVKRTPVKLANAPIGFTGPAKKVQPPRRPASIDSHLDRINLFTGENRTRVAAALRIQGGLAPNSLLQMRGVRGMRPGDQFFEERDVLGLYNSGSALLLIRDTSFNATAERRFQAELRTGFASHCGKNHDSIDNLTAHEIGHHIDAMMKRGGPVARKEVWVALANGLGIKPPSFFDDESLRRWMAKNSAVLKKDVSKYGATDPFELIAEVWAEYSLGDPPRPHIKAAGDVLKTLAERNAAR